MSLNDEREMVERLVDAAVASLEASRTRIDDLNVYPVPDGDTGTNLAMTMRAVAEAVDRTTAGSRQSLARDLARGALMGARGNSGVIFSQIVRGAADVLGAIEAATIDGAATARAFRGASDAAYRAVRRPVEGTMLSVIRGEAIPEASAAEEHAGADALHQELSRYRYCTVFLIEGAGLDCGALENELERLGDSLLVVGDSSAIKVHVHTDDPGAALSIGTRVGTIDRIEIANMHEQTLEREERLLAAAPAARAARSGVVAVVAGSGNRRLFESLAVGPLRVVEGGQTMNPSTADLLRAVQSLDAEEAIILPNNSNVVLAAEHAAANADREVEVVSSDSIPAGLAAMVAFDGSRAASENAVEMHAAVEAVATGEVTTASRDVQLNGLAARKGDWLGLAGGEPVSGGESFEDVTCAVVERLLGGDRGLLTFLVGREGADLEGVLRRVGEAHPDVEIEVQEGGQPHYALLLSAE
jgi:dihydroxyacetone kinase-like predicted kinase